MGLRVSCHYCGRFDGEAYAAAPAAWPRVEGQWRSQTVVWYRWCCPGLEEEIHEEFVGVCAQNISRADPRSVPQPRVLLSKLRRKNIEKILEQVRISTGCTVVLAGVAGEDGASILVDTLLEFTWSNVLNSSGLPHAASITYRNLALHKRSVPHCPFRLRDGHGFQYNVAFMDAFAANVRVGLAFEGIMFDGPVPDMRCEVPCGGIG